MRELLIEKSKTIQIPVIIGNEEDLKSRGLSKEEVFAPILVRDCVLADKAFSDSYPKAVFIDTNLLFDLQNAEFFSLIAYSMRFALENSANLYGYIINHLYELCDLDHETLEELFEEIYKVHKRILTNKTKEERSKISLMEALGDFFLAKDAFPESDAIAFGCISGAYYSYKKELISTEDYYEIRDMFVPFGISITQTKLGKKELFDEFNAYINGRDDLDKICILKKIGKIQDAFDGKVDDSYNENFFESVYFDEFDNE